MTLDDITIYMIIFLLFLIGFLHIFASLLFKKNSDKYKKYSVILIAQVFSLIRLPNLQVIWVFMRIIKRFHTYIAFKKV